MLEPLTNDFCSFHNLHLQRPGVIGNGNRKHMLPASQVLRASNCLMRTITVLVTLWQDGREWPICLCRWSFGARGRRPSSFTRVISLRGPLDLGSSFKRKLQDLYMFSDKSLPTQIEIFCVFLPGIETAI